MGLAWALGMDIPCGIKEFVADGLDSSMWDRQYSHLSKFLHEAGWGICDAAARKSRGMTAN